MVAGGSRLDHSADRRVRGALRERGSDARVVELAGTARTAPDAAAALGVAQGAIVKSLLFTIDGDPVLALVAGDRRCDTRALPGAFGRPAGLVARADADTVYRVTGFRIGGVAPVAHLRALPCAIDDSLQRFETVYAAAGHPFCVFPTTVWELSLLTGGAVVRHLSAPPD